MFCPKSQYFVRMSMRVKGIVKKQRRMSEKAMLAMKMFRAVNISWEQGTFQGMHSKIKIDCFF